MENNIEILAPAGDFETFKAAVNNGADAVYIGGKKFSARKNAVNFSDDEIFETVKYAHLRGAKVYVTLNTLLKDSELEAAVEFVKLCDDANVDALIIQDLAVLEIIKSCNSNILPHASTQMTITNVSGVKKCEEMGYTRVVLARELSYDEIKKISGKSKCELEVFVHGALCVCCSGQCLLSSVIGSRSGNRGDCAQPCRLWYNLIDYSGKRVFKSKKYLISLKDLCLVDDVEKLKKAGVKSLKIEGRMKSKEYVSLVSNAYFNAKKDGRVSDKTIAELENIFSRSGFTKAYFDAHICRDMLNFDRNNDLVYKNIDENVLKKASEMAKNEYRKRKIDIFVKIFENEKLSVRFSDKFGNEVLYESSIIAQKAQNAALDKEKLELSFSKLGGTAFSLDNFNCDIGENLFVSAKDLNFVRREGIRLLEEKILCINNKKTFKNFEYKIEEHKIEKSDFTVSVRTFEQLETVLKEKMFAKIFVPYSLYKDNEKVLKSDGRVVCVLYDTFGDKMPDISQIDRVSAVNIGQLDMCRGKEAFSEASLNITNSVSLDIYRKMGVSCAHLSNELTIIEIKNIVKSIDTEITVYGKIAVMLTKACIVKNGIGKCGCEAEKFLYTEDRTGRKFPVIANKLNCTNTIFNANPIVMSDRLNELKSIGVRYFRLEFTDESADMVKNIIRLYKTGEKCDFDFTRGHYYRGV
ncbi:MAG: DUF3656 domain-containing protein [Oscillospiraceae bacterium]|nr:DUF3656 domain-containing protein [Oscillospiraceae bacterium]